jgi:hypothetical protein
LDGAVLTMLRALSRLLGADHGATEPEIDAIALTLRYAPGCVR